MFLFTVAKTLGSPVSNFYPIQMAWVYRTRGPGQVWASSTIQPIDFYPSVEGSSLQWDSTALCAGTGSSRVTSNLARIVSELLF